MADERESETFLQRRISRRGLMRGALASGALAGLALTGCGTNSNNSGNTNSKASSAGTTSPARSSPAAAFAVTSTAAAVNLKGQKLSILSGTYFVAAAQDTYAKQVKDWGTQNGVDATIDFIQWPDLQAKIAAGIQAGSGPDIIQTQQYWTALYADNLLDVSSIVDPMGQAGGGFWDWAETIGKVKGKWVHVPQGNSPGVQNYRISYLKQAGYDKFPDTWDDYFAMAKKLKAMGKPVGQALGHSTGDPASLVYPLLWSYGGME
ncbi:MAG: ABC transporter substrate-binding protein, partial [Dehalococcoidia bacterium]